MDLTQFTTDSPVIRHDGWNLELKIKFLDRLSAAGTVTSACALAGMSREAAYRLRRRDPLFARGWNAALALARDAGSDTLACHAIEGIEEHVWYRGELVGTRIRHDGRLLLAHLARLDRLVENHPAGPDAERFDELLALMAGAEPPNELANEGELPDCRESCIDQAAEEAALAHRLATVEDEPDDENAYFAMEQECAVKAEQAGLSAAALWDAWFRRACGMVDEIVSPRTVSTVSTSGSPSAQNRHPDLVSGSISNPAQARLSDTTDAETSSA